MATRIYLPSSGSPAVTPSTWNFSNVDAGATINAGVKNKIGSTMTSRVFSTGTTSPFVRGTMQYVYGPIGAQTISGTVKMQMRGQESASGANAQFAIAVKIIQPDGSDRAVLLEATNATSNSSPYELLTSLTNRRVYSGTTQPIPLTSQDAQAGDYLVIEIGFRSQTTTNRNVTMRVGDAAANDMEDDTTSTNDYSPYVEFSSDIDVTDVSDTQPAYVAGKDTSLGSQSAYTEGMLTEILLPDGDISQSGDWKNQSEGSILYTSLDEQPGSDSDYVYYDSGAYGEWFEVSLDNPSGTPGTGPVRIVWRIGDLTATGLTQFTIELRQGNTVIATITQDVPNTATDFSYVLSSGEVAAISDWNDLRIRITISEK